MSDLQLTVFLISFCMPYKYLTLNLSQTEFHLIGLDLQISLSILFSHDEIILITLSLLSHHHLSRYSCSCDVVGCYENEYLFGTKSSRMGRAGHWYAVDRVAPVRSKTRIGWHSWRTLVRECRASNSISYDGYSRGVDDWPSIVSWRAVVVMVGKRHNDTGWPSKHLIFVHCVILSPVLQHNKVTFTHYFTTSSV